MDDYPVEVQQGLKELEEHYTDFEVNSRGANGYLFLANNKVSNQDVAIKFYAGEPGLHQHDEPRQLAALKSDNVLPILDARVVSDDWGYFVTPRCKEGDLDDFIQQSPSAHHALDTALGICNGVSAIHAAGMLHRDLKPGNIVIDGGRPRIADFGSVKAISADEEYINAPRHSILYRPPESFATDQYTARGDIYQVGLLIYQLLGGSLPYDGEKYLSRSEIREYSQIEDEIDKSIFIDNIIRMRAESGKLIRLSTLPLWVPGSARRFLNITLNPNPENRYPTIAEVAAGLTQVRSTVKDWRWHDDCPTLFMPDHTIQLRKDPKLGCVAYKKSNGGDFRRIPRLSSHNMAILTRKI